MVNDAEHLRLRKATGIPRCYSPDTLPKLQAVLADLADLDVAYEQRLEGIKKSPVDDECKSKLIASIRQQLREDRAPYIQELVLLREEIEAMTV